MRAAIFALLALVVMAGCVAEGPPAAAEETECLAVNYTPAAFPDHMQPMLFANFRWNHMPITVYAYTQNATDADIAALRQGMAMWAEQTEGLVSFREVSSPQADLTVRWTEEVPNITQEAVELGVSKPRAVDTGLFNLSRGGEISIVTMRNFTTECPELIAAHELGHALGLDHPVSAADQAKCFSIMYPELHCQQRVTPDIVYMLGELYRTQAAPDLAIGAASATRRGQNIDVEVVVTNRGLLDSNATQLQVAAGGRVVGTFDIRAIDPGSELSVSIRVTAAADIDEVELAIDPDRSNADMYPDNNMIVLGVAQ